MITLFGLKGSLHAREDCVKVASTLLFRKNGERGKEGVVLKLKCKSNKYDRFFTFLLILSRFMLFPEMGVFLSA